MKSKNIPLIATVLVLFAMACMCTDTANLATPTVAVPAATTVPDSPSSNSSGIITNVILARDVEGDLVDPVDPTTVFNSDSVIHAVVQIEDAPANTNFVAEFYVVDVGSAAEPGSLITSTDLTADGTRNLDFSLTPTTSWPSGTYRVDILVNGQLDQSVEYTVQ